MNSDCLDMIKTCGKGEKASLWSVVGFGDLMFLVQESMVNLWGSANTIILFFHSHHYSACNLLAWMNVSG
jgi:hypothetical protein